METFLWDGCYDLSSVLVNLHITSLPCIPSQELFNSTVEDLTMIVSYQCMQLNTYNVNLYYINCNFLQLKVYTCISGVCLWNAPTWRCIYWIYFRWKKCSVQLPNHSHHINYHHNILLWYSWVYNSRACLSLLHLYIGEE